MIFRENFNQPVDKLPDSITHLTFTWEFNQPVDQLPNSLTHLTFGCYFNQPVDKLPNSITHLIFRENFNQPVDKLPSSVTHLMLGWSFDQSLKNLPSNIYYLGFESISLIKDDIPSTINTVEIYFSYYYDSEDDYLDEIINNLPSTIKKIIVNDITKIDFITKIPFGCEIVDDDLTFFPEQ